MKDCNKTGMTECPQYELPTRVYIKTRDAPLESTCAAKLSLRSFSTSFAL
jgi:hypothetical protein